MKSGKSYFNAGVFWKTVRRFWPIWGIYLLIWFLALPARIATDAAAFGAEHAAWTPIDAVETTACWLCPITAATAAGFAFSHLYSEKASNFYAALPLRREGMYLSCMSAGLAPLLAVNLLIYAVSALVCLGCGASPSSFLVWLGSATLELLAFYGIGVFCAMLTGSAVMMPLLVIAFNVAGTWMGTVMGTVPARFSYGWPGGYSGWHTALSPFIAILNYVQVDYVGAPAADGLLRTARQIVGWKYLIAYGALGAALLAASLPLYRRRRMENAGDTVAIAPLRPVFKYVVAFCAAFILGSAAESIIFFDAYEDGLAYALRFCLLAAAGAFIGYFGAEMILNKSFAVFRGWKRYAGWLAVSAVCALVVLGVELDVTGYEKRVPDAGEIESAAFSVSGEGEVVFTGAEELNIITGLHESLIQSKEPHQSLARDYGCIYVDFDYRLKDGGELRRAYELPVNDKALVSVVEGLMNRPKAILERTGAPAYLSSAAIVRGWVEYYPDTEAHDSGHAQALELTPREAARFYNECVYPDLREARLGLADFNLDEDYYESSYDCVIRIELTYHVVEAAGYPASIDVSPTIYSERTNEWLQAKGVPLITLAENAA